MYTLSVSSVISDRLDALKYGGERQKSLKVVSESPDPSEAKPSTVSTQ